MKEDAPYSAIIVVMVITAIILAVMIVVIAAFDEYELILLYTGVKSLLEGIRAIRA